jgi:hypothetical protein
VILHYEEAKLRGGFPGEAKTEPTVYRVAALVAGVGILASLVGSWSTIKDFFSTPEASNINTEIVLDSSSRMLEPYENQTRFEIARQELISTLRLSTDSEVLGFRVFGGESTRGEQAPCDNTKLLVKLGLKNVTAVTRSLEDLKLQGGESPLGRTLALAIGDFNDTKRFPPEKHKTVVVVTAGFDDCDPGYVETLKKKIGSFPNLDIAFKLIGLGVRAQDASGLEALSALLKTQTRFVAKPQELNQVLKDVLIRESFLTNERDILDGLSNMVEKLNNAMAATRSDEVGEAQKRLVEGEGYFARTQNLYEELKNRRYSDTAARIIETVRLLRDDQGRCLSYVRQIVSLVQGLDARVDGETFTGFLAYIGGPA